MSNQRYTHADVPQEIKDRFPGLRNFTPNEGKKPDGVIKPAT